MPGDKSIKLGTGKNAYNLNLDNLKSGVKRDAVKNFGDLFDLYDTDKNKVLSQNEIAVLKADVQKAAKDSVFSADEANQMIKDKSKGALKDNLSQRLFAFLGAIEGTPTPKPETTPTKRSKQEQIAFEDAELADRKNNRVTFTENKYNTFEEMARAHFLQEGVKNPTDRQIQLRIQEYKSYNPNLKDGEIIGKKVIVSFSKKTAQGIQTRQEARDKQKIENQKAQAKNGEVVFTKLMSAKGTFNDDEDAMKQALNTINSPAALAELEKKLEEEGYKADNEHSAVEKFMAEELDDKYLEDTVKKWIENGTLMDDAAIRAQARLALRKICDAGDGLGTDCKKLKEGVRLIMAPKKTGNPEIDRRNAEAVYNEVNRLLVIHCDNYGTHDKDLDDYLRSEVTDEEVTELKQIMADNGAISNAEPILNEFIDSVEYAGTDVKKMKSALGKITSPEQRQEIEEKLIAYCKDKGIDSKVPLQGGIRAILYDECDGFMGIGTDHDEIREINEMMIANGAYTEDEAIYVRAEGALLQMLDGDAKSVKAALSHVSDPEVISQLNKFLMNKGYENLEGFMNTKFKGTEAEKKAIIDDLQAKGLWSGASYNIDLDLSDPETQEQFNQGLIATFSEEYLEADKSFKEHLKTDGWTADVADFVSKLWNNDVIGGNHSADQVRKRLGELGSFIDKLNAAQSQDEFNRIFKDYTGVDYDPIRIANYMNHKAKYENVASIYYANEATNNLVETTFKNYDQTMNEAYRSRTYGNNTNALYDDYKERRMEWGAEEEVYQMFNTLIGMTRDEWNQRRSQAITEGRDFISEMYKYALQIRDQMNARTRQLIGNVSETDILAMKKDLDAHRNMAFGKNNALELVEDYNSSQEVGSAVVSTVVQTAAWIAASALSGGSATVVGLSCATAYAAVEVSDRMTNGIDNSEDLWNAEFGNELALGVAIEGFTGGFFETKFVKGAFDKFGSKIATSIFGKPGSVEALGAAGKTVGGVRHSEKYIKWFRASMSKGSASGTKDATKDVVKQLCKDQRITSYSDVAVKAVAGFVIGATMGAFKLKWGDTSRIKNIDRFSKLPKRAGAKETQFLLRDNQSGSETAISDVDILLSDIPIDDSILIGYIYNNALQAAQAENVEIADLMRQNPEDTEKIIVAVLDSYMEDYMN